MYYMLEITTVTLYRVHSENTICIDLNSKEIDISTCTYYKYSGKVKYPYK